jgi:hypothetical protein
MSEIKFEELTQAQVNQSWKMLQDGPLKAILKHAFDKKIEENRQKYDTLTDEKEFIKLQAFIGGLKDQASIIRNTKPPTAI